MALSSAERSGRVRPSGVPTSISKASSAGNIGLTPSAILKVSSISGGKVAALTSRKCGRNRTRSSCSRPVCQGKPLGPGVRTKAKARSPIKPDEGLRHLLARHTLDWVATGGLDGADPFHADPPMRPDEPRLLLGDDDRVP